MGLQGAIHMLGALRNLLEGTRNGEHHTSAEGHKEWVDGDSDHTDPANCCSMGIQVVQSDLPVF